MASQHCEFAQSSQHFSQSLGWLLDTAELSDITVVIQAHRFNLHRNILASNIPYFRAMLLGGMQESQQKEVTIQDLTPDAFQCVVDFMYRGKTRVPKDTLIPLLHQCKFISFVSLEQQVARHVVSHLTYYNVLPLLELYASPECAADATTSGISDNNNQPEQVNEDCDFTPGLQRPLPQGLDAQLMDSSEGCQDPSVFAAHFRHTCLQFIWSEGSFLFKFWERCSGRRNRTDSAVADSIANMSPEVLLEIIDCDNLQCHEMTVFYLIALWARLKDESTKRQQQQQQQQTLHNNTPTLALLCHTPPHQQDDLQSGSDSEEETRRDDTEMQMNIEWEVTEQQQQFAGAIAEGLRLALIPEKDIFEIVRKSGLLSDTVILNALQAKALNRETKQNRPRHRRRTFDFTISRFSQRTGKVYSEPIRFKREKWRLLVFPKGNTSEGDVSFYLTVADENKIPVGKNAVLRFVLTVVNQYDDARSKSRELFHTFTKCENDWGFVSFLKSERVLSPTEGFCVDDCVMFRVQFIDDSTETQHLSAAAPSHEP